MLAFLFFCLLGYFQYLSISPTLKTPIPDKGLLNVTPDFLKIFLEGIILLGLPRRLCDVTWGLFMMFTLCELDESRILQEKA